MQEEGEGKGTRRSSGEGSPAKLCPQCCCESYPHTWQEDVAVTMGTAVCGAAGEGGAWVPDPEVMRAVTATGVCNSLPGWEL